LLGPSPENNQVGKGFLFGPMAVQKGISRELLLHSLRAQLDERDKPRKLRNRHWGVCGEAFEQEELEPSDSDSSTVEVGRISRSMRALPPGIHDEELRHLRGSMTNTRKVLCCLSTAIKYRIRFSVQNSHYLSGRTNRRRGRGVGGGEWGGRRRGGGNRRHQ